MTLETQKIRSFRPKAKLRAIANEAPALIPSKPESAKGFLVTPCINAPLNAKQLLQEMLRHTRQTNISYDLVTLF